jgi:hypothetical protein
MSENDPYGSEGGASNERPYPYPKLVPQFFFSRGLSVFITTFTTTR